jgi:hypothetical protein
MKLSGIICHGAGESVDYLQIVAVKRCEREAYMRSCPDPNVVFFELPASADSLGIGAARYHMKRLATSICPADFPFCFFLDDSVQYWKGITLPGDPEPMFGECADDAPKLTDISLADVLIHYQSEPFALADLRQFGMIGFHRMDGRNRSKAAYARRHVYSAIIMNLDKMRGVDYKENCFLWEDLDFNKRASEAGAVLCKCYRFGMGKKPGMPGGCGDMVPRPSALRVEELNPPVPDVWAGLRSWLDGIPNLANVDHIYAQLKSEDIDQALLCTIWRRLKPAPSAGALRAELSSLCPMLNLTGREYMLLDTALEESTRAASQP